MGDISNIPPIAIIAGGLGTRLYPVTATIPKSLVEVAGEPFVAHQLRLLARRGVSRVVFCVGHYGDQIEAVIGDGRAYGLSVQWSYDGDKLLGTGGAVRKALPLLGPDFLVTYGDSYLDIPYAPIVAAFRSSGVPALMTVFRNADAWDSSNVEFSGGRIVRYDKVNKVPSMRHIDYGLLAMTAASFARQTDGPFDLSVLLGRLVEEGQLAGFETTQRFYETGSHQGIEELAAHLRAQSHRLETGVQF